MATTSVGDEDLPDYMSDVFVVEGKTKPTKKQVKRLNPKKSTKNKKQLMRLNTLERDNLVEGLATPIDSDNKGFKLLHKMGYTPGESLGKPRGGNNIIEPIPVVIKEDRVGIGRDSFVKESQEKQELLKQQQLEVFHDHCRSSVWLRQVKTDLKKSQKSCQHLDTANGHNEPLAGWYWGDYEQQDDDDDGLNNQDIPDNEEEQLMILTDYLRREYFYCLWCGVNYSSEIEMVQNCPGSNFQSHNC